MNYYTILSIPFSVDKRHCLLSTPPSKYPNIHPPPQPPTPASPNHPTHSTPVLTSPDWTCCLAWAMADWSRASRLFCLREFGPPIGGNPGAHDPSPCGLVWLGEVLPWSCRGNSWACGGPWGWAWWPALWGGVWDCDPGPDPPPWAAPCGCGDPVLTWDWDEEFEEVEEEEPMDWLSCCRSCWPDVAQVRCEEWWRTTAWEAEWGRPVWEVGRAGEWLWNR